MGRQQRFDFLDAFHHVFNQASARRMIFTVEWQRKAFLETLEHVVKSDNIEAQRVLLDGQSSPSFAADTSSKSKPGHSS